MEIAVTKASVDEGAQADKLLMSWRHRHGC